MSFEFILNQIVNSVHNYPDRYAFSIGNKRTTYAEFGKTVASIQHLLNSLDDLSHHIGVVMQDDVYTYASLVAIWLQGKAYVPINPLLPSDRNSSIIQQSEITILLNSGDSILSKVPYAMDVKEYNVDSYGNDVPTIQIKRVDESLVAYILYTSGSTGIPKGVPILRSNIAAFMEGVNRMGMQFSYEDKFLQMFDLTFDLSVWSFLQPLCVGACQYPIPRGEIKYMYTYELLDEHEISVALLVPSVLNFLRPYFEDLHFPHLKYSLFCGEALYCDIAKEWLNIVPNAKVYNVYGPTEATIFCSQYEIIRDSEIVSEKGIVSIGKPLVNTKLLIVDQNNIVTNPNQRGELSIGGLQVTPGYIQNDHLNNSSFFYVNDTRYYRSGDICFYSLHGDIMFSGRLDSQIKIQGFRIELSEIEFQARIVCDPNPISVVSWEDENGLHEIHLFVENTTIDAANILSELKKRLPTYMLPKTIHALEKFPLNINGKTDKKALRSLLDVAKIAIRRANNKDVEFLVDAIINAEKSGTDKLSYSTIFKIPELEVREILKQMLLQNEGYCELSIDSFLIAELRGKPVSAVASWIEGEDDVPSAIIKANLLFSFMPSFALQNLKLVSTMLDKVHIPRKIGALQLESIYTIPEYRGKGIVKLLIDNHITLAKNKMPEINCAQILLSDINVSALNAYMKSDFKLTLHKTSEDPQISAILPSNGTFCLEKLI